MKRLIFVTFCLLFTNAYSQEVEHFWEEKNGFADLYKVNGEYVYISKIDEYYVRYSLEDISTNSFGYFTWDNKGKIGYILQKQILIPGKSVSVNFSNPQFTQNETILSNVSFNTKNIRNISASDYYSETIRNVRISYKPENMLNRFFYGDNINNKMGEWNYKSLPWVVRSNDKESEPYIEASFVQPIVKISLLNGYVDIHKMNLFRENSRAAIVEVFDLDNNFKYDFSLPDFVCFSDLILKKPTNNIKITIKEIFEGSKYPDLCISSLIFHTSINEKEGQKVVQSAFKYFEEK